MDYSYSSYADSGDSSPQSREIDCDNPSWEESLNYKVKFMCSYGGKIHPRPHDNQLAYVSGDTKILTVDRNIRFSGIISKLASLCDADVCFKYQLPGEDLDALISVTNDEDLEHMMLEYDRVQRASPKPSRLRLFLFPLNPSAPTSFGSNETKTDQQWFVDALNSVPIQPIDASSPPASVTPTNPDFLFGLDKGISPPSATKMQDPTLESPIPEITSSKISVGSDPGREDREIGAEPVVYPSEIQRQIQDLQRLHIANQEQAMFQKRSDENAAIEIHRQIQDLQRLQIANQEQALFQKRSDENLVRAFAGDYYTQKLPEKTIPTPSPIPVPVPPTVSVPAAYWQERNMTTGGYPPAAASATGTEQPIYLIPAPVGMYQPQNVRPVSTQTGHGGQGYYAMQRMVPDVYRESPPVYSVAPPPPQQPKVGVYAEGIGMVRPTGGGMAVGPGEAGGFTQVAYDSAGRQVYYTTPGGVVPSYQTVTTVASVDHVRQAGALNQDAKVAIAKPPQASV